MFAWPAALGDRGQGRRWTVGAFQCSLVKVSKRLSWAIEPATDRRPSGM